MESGVVVYVGMLLLLIKLPRRIQLRLLGYDVAVDLSVSAVTLAIHWGTFSGIMAATIAGLLMSLTTTAMRYLVGYIKHGKYQPGYFALKL